MGRYVALEVPETDRPEQRRSSDIGRTRYRIGWDTKDLCSLHVDTSMKKKGPIPEDHQNHKLDHLSGSEGSLESYDVDYTSDEENYLSDPEPTQNLHYLPWTGPRTRTCPILLKNRAEEARRMTIPGVTRARAGLWGPHRASPQVPGGPRATALGPPPPTPPHSPPGCGDMTLTPALALEEPLGSQQQVAPCQTPSWGEGPGILPQGAEPAEQRSAEVQRADRRKPDSHRRRQARPSLIERESERRVKETKSKCKRLALLLTGAPNPQSKGVLLCKKCRQRVRRNTQVSYGTT
ncbi:unnamed protein product [Boreogadus saida]